MLSGLRSSFLSPGRLVLAALCATIAVGTILLLCPWAQAIPTGWRDCLFTSTSTVCVTGLYTVPLSNFTTAGHFVILLLMQAGSLGLITLSVFFLSLFTTMGLSTRSAAGEALDLEAGQHPKRLVIFTLCFTLAVELIGAALCYGTIRGSYSVPYGLFLALFHAASSFCHVGITLLPMKAGALLGSTALLWITGTLVFLGSLGFVVWRELAWYLTSQRAHKHVHLSLHSKLVISTTTALTIIAALILFMLEYAPSFAASPSVAPFGDALFNSLCLRSAGFTTLPIGSLSAATLFFIMVVSFIGAAPGSAASGIKVTTLAVVLAAIRATLLRRTAVEVKYRTIPNDQVFKAVSIFALSIAWAAFFVLLLLITDGHLAPFDLIFETISCFSNVGLSRGIVPLLSEFGKVLIMLTMIVGRIGALAVLLALTKQTRSPEFHYPEERLLLS